MARADDFLEAVHEWDRYLEATHNDGHLRVVEVGGSEIGDAYSFEDLGAVTDWVLRRSGRTPEMTDAYVDVHVEIDYGTEDRSNTLATASVAAWSNDQLEFDWHDGSRTRMSFDPLPVGPLDSGAPLLEPITAIELAGIERILAVLEQQVRDGELDAFVEQRILTLADIVREERIATTPSETERWKLVGLIRSALRYSVKELPRDGLALVKFTEILIDINWHDLAKVLPGV